MPPRNISRPITPDASYFLSVPALFYSEFAPCAVHAEARCFYFVNIFDDFEIFT